MTPSKVIKDVCVLLLVNNKNEFLISKRRVDSFKGGYYELPGGKCEAGKSLLETVQREIKEETSYNLKRAKLVYETFVTYDFGTFPLHVFYAKLDISSLAPALLSQSTNNERPKLPALEADSLTWVSPQQAKKLKLLPILAEMLETEIFKQLLSADRN